MAGFHYLKVAGMRRSVVAVAQMTSVGSTAKNWECCKNLVKSASEAGASFVCLPEGFHFIGTHFTQSLQAAEPLTGPTITKYKELARETAMWLSLGGKHGVFGIFSIFVTIDHGRVPRDWPR